MPTTAVIIPAYQAAASLREVLKRTRLAVPECDIIVVDDGSTDATAEIASESLARLLRHPANRGKGAALRTAFDHAREKGYEAVVTMDADLQHRPEDIPRLLAARTSTGADVIIGSRLQKSTMPLHRKLSNAITTFLVRARTGADIRDSQSGFRCIGRECLHTVRWATDGFEAETEFLIAAARQGFTFGWIPIDTVYANERSHMTNMRTTMAFIKVLFGQY